MVAVIVSMLLLCLFYFSSASFAQNKIETKKKNPNQEALSRGIALKLEKKLQWLLTKNRFRIEAEAVAKKKFDRNMPYLPGALTPDAIALQEFGVIAKEISVLDVKIFTTVPLNQKQRDQIIEFIKSSFSARPELMLTVDFKDIEAPPAEGWQITNDTRYLNLKEEIRKLESGLTRAKVLEKQSSDNVRGIDTKLKLAQNEAERLAREAAAKDLAIDKVLKMREPIVSLLRRHIPHFAVAVMVAILFLLLLSVMRSYTRIIGQAYQSVAGSIQSVSDSLANMSPQSKAEEEKVNSPQNLGNGFPNGPISIESADEKLTKIKDDLLRRIGDNNLGTVLQFLSRTMSQKDSTWKAAAMIEVLGKDFGPKIFSGLSANNQLNLLKFFQTLNYPAPKHEVILNAAEALSTAVLAGALLASRARTKDDINLRLASLSVAQIKQLVVNIDAGAIPRLLLYLDESLLNELIFDLRSSNRERYTTLVSCLGELSNAESMYDYDDLILANLTGMPVNNQQAKDEYYAKIVKEIVSRSDEEMASELVESIATTNPGFGAILRRGFVSAKTLFALLPEVQTEVIAQLSNREIAAFYLSSLEIEQGAIFASITQRRQALVREEMKLISDMDEVSRRGAAKQAREKIISTIQGLVASGKLLLDDEQRNAS